MGHFARIATSGLLMLAAASAALAQRPDSCLVLAGPTYLQGMEWNPDSVRLDTCGCTMNFAGREYAQQWWGLSFAHHLIDLPAAPPDTILEVTWQAIDTSYTAVRDSMALIESRFGTFYLRKVFPGETDSLKPATELFNVRFETLVNVDSVAAALGAVPNVEASFLSQPSSLTYVPNDRGLVPNTGYGDIAMHDPNQTFWPRHLHRRGFLWNHFAMRTPNAWSLTTGVTPPDRPPVFHFISDELRGSQVTHPDMGNFRTVKGDGYQTRALYAGLGVAHHGLSVLSCSIGLGDNDEVQTEGEGQVGTCYNCLGVAVQDGSYYKDVVNVDVDNIADATLTPPPVDS